MSEGISAGAAATTNLDSIQGNAAANVGMATDDHLASSANLSGPLVSHPGATPYSPTASTAIPTSLMFPERPNSQDPPAAAGNQSTRSYIRLERLLEDGFFQVH